jgi:hypothetical protein
MAAETRKTERRTGTTPPASLFHEEYYPIQSFAWVGKSGDAATDFPYCGDADYDQIEDTGLAGLDMAAHDDDAYLIWRVPQQMDIGDDLGVQLVYTSTGTAAQTISASGKVAWKLGFATIGEGQEMSGLTYSTPVDNGKDFEEISYTADDTYSGEAKLMSSSWAVVSGYTDGDPESGSNFRHGDLIVFKFTRDSGSVGTNIPVALIGATVRYKRDRL